MNIAGSDGNWLYTFRCRECDLRYDRRPTDLPIGPMFLTKPGALIDSVDGIDCYESVMVYDGPRRELKCADCLLKPCFPLAIDPDLWRSWMVDHADILRDDDILRSYVELAEANPDGSIGYPESLHLPCLRCTGQLHAGRIARRCPNCGDNNRIDLIKSHSLSAG